MATSGRGKVAIAALWASQMCSLVADDMQQFALKLYLHERSQSASAGSPGSAGSTLASLTPFVVAVELPSLLLSPLVGALVDRLASKRALILAADTLAAVCTLGLAALLLRSDDICWPILYPLCALNALASCLQWPSFQILMRTLVADRRHVTLFTQSAPALSMLFAPLLASYLFSTQGLAGVFAVSMGTWLLAVVATIATPPTATVVNHNTAPTDEAEAATDSPETEGFPTVSQLAEDAAAVLNVVWHRPALLAAAWLTFAGYLASGMVQLLMVPLVLASSAPTVLGWILTLSGLGSIAGLAFPAQLPLATRGADVLFFTHVGQGVLLMFCGAVPETGVLFLFAFLFMAMIPTVRACRLSLVHMHVPANMVGRTLAMQKALMQVCVPLAAACARGLADPAEAWGPWVFPSHPAPAAGLLFVATGAGLAAAAVTLRPALLISQTVERDRKTK